MSIMSTKVQYMRNTWTNQEPQLLLVKHSLLEKRYSRINIIPTCLLDLCDLVLSAWRWLRKCWGCVEFLKTNTNIHWKMSFIWKRQCLKTRQSYNIWQRRGKQTAVMAHLWRNSSSETRTALTDSPLSHESC